MDLRINCDIFSFLKPTCVLLSFCFQHLWRRRNITLTLLFGEVNFKNAQLKENYPSCHCIARRVASHAASIERRLARACARKRIQFITDRMIGINRGYLV